MKLSLQWQTFLQFNHFAIFAAVRVLGVSKAIELFHKTAQIQREGGQLTANADRK